MHAKLHKWCMNKQINQINQLTPRPCTQDNDRSSSDLLVACSGEDFQHGPSCAKRGERCASIAYTAAARSQCKLYTGSSQRRGGIDEVVGRDRDLDTLF
jgi:hypothetical protein